MNKRYTSGPKLKELLIACNDQLSNGKIKIMLTIREFGKKSKQRCVCIISEMYRTYMAAEME